jgi:transketolase
MNTEPMIDKWKSFGWEVIEINGHDLDEIDRAVTKAIDFNGKPVCIVANTIKGKGVSFMEDLCEWHGKTPSPEEKEKAIGEIYYFISKTPSE